MNIISRAIQSVRKALSPVAHSGRGWVALIREPFSGAWQRNMEQCSDEELLRSPIVYACMTLIANDIGKLRAYVTRWHAKDGIWQEDAIATKGIAVLRKPNRYQNHIQFKQWWIMSKLRRGNTYALKERNGAGQIVALYVLDPDRVQPLVSDDGSVFYRLAQDNLTGLQQSEVTVPASEIIHDRMNCLYHPLVGVSPLGAAAIAAGIGIRIQGKTLQFFANNATPGGILIAPGNITPENAAQIKAQWQSGYTGDNAGKVAVLGDGMKFEPMSTDAVDSQLIETLRWSDERICSVFHVPAYKVGVGQAPSYNNVEALDRAYYSDCLQSPIEEMEACLDDGLGFDGIASGITLDLDGLLRMDSKTQMEVLKLGVDGSVMHINKARQKLNLPPLEGGDTVYMQQQDYPLDQVRLNRIAQEESAPAASAPALSEEDQQAIDEAKALVATHRAIKAARAKALTHVQP